MQHNVPAMVHDPPVDGWNFRLWHDRVFLATTAALGLSIAAVVLWPGPASLIPLCLSAVLFLLLLYFFRNPQRRVLAEPDVAVSPGDGKVVEVRRVKDAEYPGGEATCIGIFLSVLDVHVQRAPLDGIVRRVEHRRGSYMQAFRPEASTHNERISMLMQTEFGPVLVRQIAGILARRCVNFARCDEHLQSGQRYGLIRFGSRVDLFLPTPSEVLVAPGQQVCGGLTPVARMVKQ
jgi:phosphatidylserine decarboxylase